MTKPTILRIVEWLPDLPDFPFKGATTVKNVYPRTPDSYGPMLTPMPISNSLINRCQGATAYVSNAGNTYLFAGDVSKLYKIQAADNYQWQDISKGGGYNIAVNDYWEFEHFNGSVIAVNLADAPQTFKMDTDTAFSDLGGGPPKARHIAVVKNAFVMLGYTTDGGSGLAPQRVWWSGAGNASSWPTPGSVAAATAQSTYIDFFGDEGVIQAVRGRISAADVLIFQESGIKRGSYAGPPRGFDFQPVANGRGTPAQHSPVVVGGVAYYYGSDGWQSCDGATCAAIGANKIDKTFRDDVDTGSMDKIIGANDPQSHMIYWSYASKSATSGMPDRLLGYNWQLQRWSLTELETEFISRQIIGIGYTLDQLYTILGYTLDTLPAPLDSSIWQGGTLNWGVFNTAHQLCYLSGKPLPATVDLGEAQPIDGRRALITSARPLIDGSGTGSLTVSIGRRERQMDPVNFAPAAPLNRYGICPQRTSGRYVRAQVQMDGNNDWQSLAGVELEIVAQGKR